MHRTQVCEFGGKTPHWSESFILNPCGDSTIRVEVWDRDNVNDDLVGAGVFNIQSLYNSPMQRSDNGNSSPIQNTSTFTTKAGPLAASCFPSKSRI